MKNNVVIIIGVIAAAIILGIIYASMYISYNNEEIALRKQAEAQRGKVEAHYDAMWKIISQQAQVSNEYKEAFKEIYPELVGERYAQDNNVLMKWIQESNPQFDIRLYDRLSQTIEVQRIAFRNDQDRMIDIVREHETLCASMVSGFFIKDKTPIEYTIVSSTKTKIAMETGIDDDVDLFGKSGEK